MEILAAIVGAIIAVLAGYWAQKLAAIETKKERDEERERLEYAILNAIDTEIRAIWNHYISDAGKDIENSSKSAIIGKTYHINGGYFRVYKGVSGQLGLITDSEKRHQIINFYICAEAMLDLIRQSNELVRQYISTKANGDMFRCMEHDEKLRVAHKALQRAAQPILADYE